MNCNEKHLDREWIPGKLRSALTSWSVVAAVLIIFISSKKGGAQTEDLSQLWLQGKTPTEKYWLQKSVHHISLFGQRLLTIRVYQRSFFYLFYLSRQQLFRFSFYKLRIKQPELSFFTNWIIIHLLDVTDWAPVLGHCGLYRLINRNLSDGCEVKGRKIYFFTTTKQGDELPELHVWFTWLSLPAGPRLDNLLSLSIKLKLTRRMIDLSPHVTRGHRLSDQTLTEWCHGDGQTDRRSWSVYYQLWRFSKPFKVID